MSHISKRRPTLLIGTLIFLFPQTKVEYDKVCPEFSEKRHITTGADKSLLSSHIIVCAATAWDAITAFLLCLFSDRLQSIDMEPYGFAGCKVLSYRYASGANAKLPEQDGIDEPQLTA
jgi:hypothetical protein